MKTKSSFKLIQASLTKFLILSCAIASPAFADGGVSDGGGGTTNPNPANPEWIVRAAGLDAGKILLLWLNQQEGAFQRLSASEQAASPFQKLFGTGKNIFDTVRSATIELRMSEPCYDKNGAPWDGSVFATKPGAICLSPFSMAPKLSEMNYQAETVALIAHELSHLLGATEEEARAIQKDAIYGLAHADFVDLAVKLDLLADPSVGGRFANLYMEIQFMLDSPSNSRASDAERISDQTSSLRDDLVLQFQKTQAVRESTLTGFQPQFLRIQVVQQGTCAADNREDPGIRRDCVDWIDRAFASNAVSSAREIGLRMDLGDVLGGPEHDGLMIRKPASRDDVAVELSGLMNFLSAVQDELTAAKDLQLVVYRK